MSVLAAVQMATQHHRAVVLLPCSCQLDVVLERPALSGRGAPDATEQCLRGGGLLVQTPAVAAHARRGALQLRIEYREQYLTAGAEVGVEHVVGLLQAGMTRLDHESLSEQNRRRRVLI